MTNSSKDSMIQTLTARPKLQFLALAFGDVIAAMRPSRVPLLEALLQMVITAAQILPARRLPERRAPAVLLIGAGNDKRSSGRLGPLESALRTQGLEVETWLPGYDEELPGWTVSDLFSRRERVRVLDFLKLLGEVRSACSTVDVPAWQRWTAQRWITVQQGRLQYFRSSVDWRATRAVVADFDRGLPAAPAVIAANEFGIPTFSLLHGDPNPGGYVPFLAQTVLGWSDLQRENLSSWGAGSQQIVVTGAHWVTTPMGRPRTPGTLRNALFVHTGNLEFREFVRRLTPEFVRLAEFGWKLRVRPHPMAKRIQVRAPLPAGVQLSTSSLADDLEWANEVFCGASSVAVEAAHHGCQVTVERGSTDQLASLLDLPSVPHPHLGPDWQRLVTPREGWPYHSTGSQALQFEVGAIIAGLNPLV